LTARALDEQASWPPIR